MPKTVIALAFLIGTGLSALAQTGPGGSMPGTAGLNPGALARTSTDSAPNLDITNDAPASLYSGSTDSGPGWSARSINPYSAGSAGGGTSRVAPSTTAGQ